MYRALKGSTMGQKGWVHICSQRAQVGRRYKFHTEYFLSYYSRPKVDWGCLGRWDHQNNNWMTTYQRCAATKWVRWPLRSFLILKFYDPIIFATLSRCTHRHEVNDRDKSNVYCILHSSVNNHLPQKERYLSKRNWSAYRQNETLLLPWTLYPSLHRCKKRWQYLQKKKLYQISGFYIKALKDALY